MRHLLGLLLVHVEQNHASEDALTAHFASIFDQALINLNSWLLTVDRAIHDLFSHLFYLVLILQRCRNLFDNEFDS